MKLIALTLLISFSSFAQTLVTIKPNDSKLASMQLEEIDLETATKKLKRIVLRSSWLKGKWKKKKKDSIFLRKDMDDKIEYFIPSNFRVISTDVTEKREKEKSKKDKKAKNKKDLIDIIKKKDLNLKQINKLLREIL
tara:strand:- start:80 stop:490 length:411 start_codon:yes stop_codon:yes gene_type:complete